MASPNLYTKRRSPPNVVPPSVSSTPSRSKSTGGGFFCKSVLFALFLLTLPMFPSQALDFVGETVFTKFWEFIHLLFVGIVVAYGFFSRRNVESSVDLRMSRVDESFLSYVSRIFQVSSVFDEDFDDNSCEFDDVRSDNCSINVSAPQASVVGKAESFVVESELEESSEYGKTNEVRAWNSQYFQGRSKVVVARSAYGLDGHVVHQPLGLPVRSLRSALRDNVAPEADNSFADSSDGDVNGKAESLTDEFFDEVLAAPPSPVVPWHFSPEMMGMGDSDPTDFHPQSVDETQFATHKSTTSSRSTVSSSSSSSSSHSSFASQTQNRFSPSRSVSQESLNSNVEEVVKEKSLQGSSLSSSPSLPPSPPLCPSPPSPELVIDDTHRRLPESVTDDTHRRASHSRHYSDGSLLEDDARKGFEDELEGNKVRGRRTEFFSKKERGSKSLKLNAESSRRGNKSRRSYPPESISSPIAAADDSTSKRRYLQQKSDTHLLEDNIRKGLEVDHNNLRVKKGRSYDSLELQAEDEKFSEPVPAVDVAFQPMNAKASRRVMHSSRGGRDTLPEKDVTRNLEDDTEDSDKSRKKDLPGNNNNKELKSNSPRLEQRSWRASSNASSLRGKSVRTIRSDRHGKDVKTDGDSSDDRAEAKVESRGRTKSRRQRQEELSIVLHQEKSSETRATFEPEEDAMEETEAEAEQQPQVTLEEEEEEEAAWESQSNASHDHNEVDRKAGEFIAKFREQIRLQKLISGEQPRGGGGGGTGIIRNSNFR